MRPSGFEPSKIEQMIADKMALVMPVLRESMPEEATPTLDQIHLAELEATKRAMKTMIGLMTDPGATVAELRAKAELAAASAPVYVDPHADELEARLAELEARLNPQPVVAEAPPPPNDEPLATDLATSPPPTGEPSTTD